MASNPKRVDKQSLPPAAAGRKVFIDSSVLIAAAISPKGSARDLVMKALRNEIQVIVSDLVIEETQRNLANKAPKALPAMNFLSNNIKIVIAHWGSLRGSRFRPVAIFVERDCFVGSSLLAMTSFDVQ